MSTTEQTTSTAARRQVSPSKAEVSEARALSKEVGLEYVDLDRYPLNAAATSLLPEQASRRQHALAIGWKYGTPVVAVARPDNLMTMDDLRTIIGRDIHAVVACESQIDAYIERMYARVEAPGTGHARPARNASESAAKTPSASLSVVVEPPSPPAPPEPHPSPKPSASAKASAPAKSPAPPEAEPVQPAGTTAPVDPAPAPEAEPAAPEAEPAAPEAEPALDLLDEVPAAAHPSEANKTIQSETEAVDALLAATKLVDGSSAAGGFRKANLDTPKQATPDLAELLVSSGQVTREEMEAALRERAATGRSLGDILSELGLVTEEDLIRASAAEAGMEFVDLNDEPLDPEATRLIPEALARRHRVLALAYRGDTPVIGMANPSDVFAVDDLRTLLGNDIHIVVCSAGQISEYLSRVYRHDRETTLAAQTAASQTSAADETKVTEITDLHSVVEDAPIVKYVNLILRQALQERASDVHIEPSADDLRIRFRIDGVLHEVTRSPKAIQGGVTTRLKVMASLDIAEHRVPQDGRITLTAGRREIDLRVATLPTVHGEKIVLRVLDKSSATLNLSELGFLPTVEKRYQVAYRKAYGTILVTGPTGSGKSTTLYATLNALNSPERNLITVEDPVEYQLRGVSQVQVNPKAGLNFANALRSILRSDPDVVLVGEIRDRETAVIAIEAALTGHLVLSSLHTNDAAGTPMRLVEMGVEPFLVGSALDCVLAQRLTRQLCENCLEDYSPTVEDLELIGFTEADEPPNGKVRFRRAVGCQACSRTGYRGRIALQELLLVDEEIERAIIGHSSNDDIQHLALEQGMVPLRQDGLRKAALGITSLEEILRVVV
ncbi:MAG: ATPase, T2SS/T4P/T4SS family [Acidimicrobiales bacterium]|jgi:type IV pilus assembly protein PilB